MGKPLYRVCWTDDARLCLKDIFLHTANEMTLKSARKIVDEIVLRTEALADTSGAHPSHLDLSRWFGRDIHFALVRSYKLIYEIDEEQETVSVLFVYHNSRRPASFQHGLTRQN